MLSSGTEPFGSTPWRRCDVTVWIHDPIRFLMADNDDGRSPAPKIQPVCFANYNSVAHVDIRREPQRQVYAPRAEMQVEAARASGCPRSYYY